MPSSPSHERAHASQISKVALLIMSAEIFSWSTALLVSHSALLKSLPLRGLALLSPARGIEFHMVRSRFGLATVGNYIGIRSSTVTSPSWFSL